MRVTTAERSYHHGNLRAALLTAAAQALEAGEELSMRAVARRAGVSPAAPYRHFADREALDSALAVEGFDRLRAELDAALADVPDSSPAGDVVATLAVAYVRFALRYPASFRLMFGHECDEADSERVRAAGRLHEMLLDVVRRLFPRSDATSLSRGLWSLAHGLAFLHLDGKLRPDPAADVDERVRASIAAVLTVNEGEHP